VRDDIDGCGDEGVICGGWQPDKILGLRGINIKLSKPQCRKYGYQKRDKI
jgi:hypothetical protein